VPFFASRKISISEKPFKNQGINRSISLGTEIAGKSIG
jgi:hypothetical protein